MVAIYTNKWFDRVVLTFILLNCIVMALEKPDLSDDSKVSFDSEGSIASCVLFHPILASTFILLARRVSRQASG